MEISINVNRLYKEFEMLGKLILHRRDIKVICKLYCGKTTYMQIENEFSKYLKMERK